MKKIQFFIREWLLKRQVKKIKEAIASIEDNITDDILEILMKAMRLFILINGSFADNIKGFSARYIFRTEMGRVDVSAIFSENKMVVKKKVIEDKDINCEVIFRDSRSLLEFLFSKNPDVLAFVLDNKLRYEGNLNYLMKFAFMARRMQTMAFKGVR